MLVRVSSGKNGVAEYLRDGLKADREAHRDQIDQRICIDGDLSLTDTIIKGMVEEDKDSNYYHITLSFGERDISEEVIKKVYDDFKKDLMSAYKSEEYNIYAEIHIPKIKSYEDKNTGELVERFPHVHVVVPKKNLLDDKSLKPFGFYKSNQEYIQAIQEKINYKHGLSSPLDNQRLFKADDSKFISRYKGDNFKGANSKLKSELFDAIQHKNITSMEDFKKELSKHGEVSIGKAGKPGEYLKVKPHGSSRNVRLEDNCFRADFIEKRILKREKPSEKQVNKLVKEWVERKSHEVKYIHSASPKLREQFKETPHKLKGAFINEQRERYYRGHDVSSRAGLHDSDSTSNRNISTSRRKSDRKSGLERGIPRGFTEIPNGLPSVSELDVARGTRRGRNDTSKLLHDNESHHLGFKQNSGNTALRRFGNEPRRRVTLLKKPHSELKPYQAVRTLKFIQSKAQKSESVVSQILESHKEHKHQENELGRFREIRRNLKADNLLEHLSASHGLVKENYSHFKAKDGSARIKVGTRALNVSDFCTKHLGLDWQETQQILKQTYSKQLNRTKRLREQNQEQRTINSIVFVSNRTTQGWNNTIDPMKESIRLLRTIKRKETYGVYDMALKDLEKHRSPVALDTNQNSLQSANETYSLEDAHKRLKQAIDKAHEMNLSVNDIVAKQNDKEKSVEFHDKNSGDKLFTDKGNNIVMESRKPSVEQTAVALTFAAEKFGVVKITGSKEFKKQVMDAAVSKDLNIVFSDKKMQEEFIKRKEEITQSKKVVESYEADTNHQSNSVESSQQHGGAETLNDVAKADFENDVRAKERYVTAYQWNEEKEVMNFTINGKTPSLAFDPKLLEDIAKKDEFLKKFDLMSIRSGQLDMKKAEGVQPVPRTFDGNASIVDTASEQQKPMKM